MCGRGGFRNGRRRYFARQGRFAAVFCAADGAGPGADGRGPAAPLFILKLELPVVCFMQNGMVRRRTDEVFVGRVGFAEYDRGKFFVLFENFFQAVARQISAGGGDLVDRKSGVDQEIFRFFQPLRDYILIDGSPVRRFEQFFQVRCADSGISGNRFQRKRLVQVAVDIEQRFFSDTGIL